MALNNKQITIVSGTAAHICTTGFGDPCIIVNIGTGTLYIGDNAPVTNLNGLPIPAMSASFNGRIDLTQYTGEVWGYASGANCIVASIESTLG